VIYVTDADSTSAVDALTGRQIWRTKNEYAPGALGIMCCGISNRGAAIYNGKLFRTTLDANVVALDLKTGKEIWRQKAIDFEDGYSMNVAPLIANGVLITGVGGAEYQTRGFLDAYDPETGKHLWRTYTIPAPGEKGSETWPGDTWKIGGGSTWLTGSYDPDLDLVYWGVGNGSSWNAEARKGDNLYTCSVIAIRPKTGEIVWHSQFSPNDLYNYDGVNELVHADLQIDGKTRKVLMQANRNGFFYVLDRASGELLAANPFTKVNWADKIDFGRAQDDGVQTGAGGISLRAAAEVRKAMIAGGVVGSFAAGGITGAHVEMLERGLFQSLLDVQCFDLAAVASLAQNPRHIGMSASTYASPGSRGAVVDRLDAVVLGAAEVDLDFNVNVVCDGSGLIIGGSGGHADTAAGAKLCLVTTRLTVGGAAKILERVKTVTTPGRTIDAVVTEIGVAVNPAREDLMDLFHDAGIPLVKIEEPASKAFQLTGERAAQVEGEPIVASVVYRDGVKIDEIQRLAAN
jgi:outer membrane protein assembly factor BamB